MEATVINADNRFSFKRFVCYASLYLSANRRKLLLGVLQVFIFSFLFNLFMLHLGGGMDMYETFRGSSDPMAIDPFWNWEGQSMLVMAFIFMAFSGSWMFRSMATRKDRLATLEIPALQSEKFLTWWCFYLPVMLLVILVSFWLSDILRVIWVKAFSPFGFRAHLIPLKYLVNFRVLNPYDTAAENHGITFIIYSLLVGCNSLFSLGSILFHKLNFLKTVIWGFVLMALSTLLYTFGRSVFFSDNYEYATVRFNMNLADNSFVAGGIIFFVAACIYLLAYCRYRDEEIINRW